MASGSQSMFIEEDDNDVNTTTTEEENDPDKEYDVECVLSEQQGEDGKMYYLIKWEGYALYDCTWETKASITSDVVLRHWEADKRAIKSGEKQPFDVDDYDRAFEEHAEEQERKRKLRKKKRRQRGTVVTSSDDDSGSTSSYDLPTTATPKRTRTKVVASPVKKKGIAQPVTKRRNTFSKGTNPSSDESRPATQHSDVDSLFGEPIEKIVAPTPPKVNRITSAPTTSTSTKQTTSTTKSGEPSTVNPAKSDLTIPKPAPAPPPEQRKPSTSSTTTASTSARKTAPTGTVGKAKPASKTGTNVFADWTRAKKPRMRPRVSGETEKDSMDPKFTKLAIQNRYQKYSRNEPAPNPDDLVMIDPKTGKTTQPAKVQAPARPPPPRSGTGPEDIHSAYGRGRSPPRNRQRTPTPPSSPRQRQEDVQTTVVPADTSDPLGIPKYYDSAIGRLPKRWRTCRHWQEGNCRYTSDTCMWLHSEVPKEVRLAANSTKQNTTCHFWATRGRCKFSDEDCEFRHYWTPETAGPPGTFDFNRRGSVAASGPPGSNDGQVRFASPTEQVATPLSPVVQVAPTTPAVAQILSPVEFEKEPAAPAPEPIADPRLRGRAARISDISAKASEEQPIAEPVRSTNEVSLANGGDVEMTDAMDISHGSLEQDIAMTQQGLAKLDPAKMLSYISTTDNSKVDIQHVYIHMPDRLQELEILRKYFRRLNRQVYTSSEIGAWSLFADKYVKRCLIIVHPTELFTGTIPGLYEFLVSFGSGFSVFSIGVQHACCIREGREPAFEAQRLFPHGNLTFISDDVFVYYPEKATRLIEEFIANTANMAKQGSPQLGKIAARPGVKDWLLRLASKKMEEHAGDSAAIAYVDLYSAICRLCPLEDEDPAYPGQHVPKESAYLWSPPASSLPSFKDRWESGDEEGATDFMANFFAGEACGKAWKYRKFHFVYQRPEHIETTTNSQGEEINEVKKDPKGWATMYSHIGVVLPDKLIKKT